jgi:hypothetical protein
MHSTEPFSSPFWNKKKKENMTQNNKTNPKIRLSFLDPNGMARKGDFRLIYRKIIPYLEENLTPPNISSIPKNLELFRY